MVRFVAADDNQWTECLPGEEEKYPIYCRYNKGAWVYLAVNYLKGAEEEKTDNNGGVQDKLGHVWCVGVSLVLQHVFYSQNVVEHYLLGVKTIDKLVKAPAPNKITSCSWCLPTHHHHHHHHNNFS